MWHPPWVSPINFMMQRQTLFKHRNNFKDTFSDMPDMSACITGKWVNHAGKTSIISFGHKYKFRHLKVCYEACYNIKHFFTCPRLGIS